MDTLEEVVKVFNKFDKDGSGELTIEEMREVFLDLGKTEEKAKKMITVSFANLKKNIYGTLCGYTGNTGGKCYVHCFQVSYHINLKLQVWHV